MPGYGREFVGSLQEDERVSTIQIVCENERAARHLYLLVTQFGYGKELALLNMPLVSETNGACWEAMISISEKTLAYCHFDPLAQCASIRITGRTSFEYVYAVLFPEE